MLGVALLQPGVDLGDLVFEVVDQGERGGHVSPPRLGDLEVGEQSAALDPEQIGDRAGPAEVDQGRVDPILERRFVLDQVEAKLASSRRVLTLGSGSQIVGTRSRWQSVAKTKESILSVLQASGARPLTFWASAISTDQPARSRVSWTILAPVIDSITAQTGWRWTSSMRRANCRSESGS